MHIADEYHKLNDEIRTLALSIGRNPDEISILAVTKTHPVETIQAAIDAGIRLFGENRVQEARDKIPLLGGDFSFDLIGHLQSNKARIAVRLFNRIHSIDRLSIARAVNDEAGTIHKRQVILLQVNTSGESSKSGCAPHEAVVLSDAIQSLPHCELAGLMTIGPLTDDEASIRNSFRTLASLRDEIRRNLGLSMPHLSMGMSSDYRIAIEEGATIVRIGSALFGHRAA